MFSSTNSLNPPPSHYPSSSCSHFPSPFPNYEFDGIFLNEHHHDQLAGPFLTTNYAPIFPENVSFAVSKYPTMTMQNNGDYNYAKKHVKKDQRSKIYTSQGLRDRRVRLSTGVARKFFDLQEMLGFDRASQTVDWLLSKSRKAIKEVAQMNQNSSGHARSSSSPTSGEVVSGINIDVNDGGNLEGRVSKSKSLVGVSKEKIRMKKVKKAASIHLLSKESRAKARERARERTREKLDAGTQIVQQYYFRSESQLEARKRSSKVVGEIEVLKSHLPADRDPGENIVEESFVIRRNLKPSERLNYPANLMISKDLSSNNGNSNYFPNLGLTWNIDSTVEF